MTKIATKRPSRNADDSTMYLAAKLATGTLSIIEKVLLSVQLDHDYRDAVYPAAEGQPRWRMIYEQACMLAQCFKHEHERTGDATAKAMEQRVWALAKELCDLGRDDIVREVA